MDLWSSMVMAIQIMTVGHVAGCSLVGGKLPSTVLLSNGRFLQLTLCHYIIIVSPIRSSRPIVTVVVGMRAPPIELSHHHRKEKIAIFSAVSLGPVAVAVNVCIMYMLVVQLTVNYRSSLFFLYVFQIKPITLIRNNTISTTSKPVGRSHIMILRIRVNRRKLSGHRHKQYLPYLQVHVSGRERLHISKSCTTMNLL